MVSAELKTDKPYPLHPKIDYSDQNQHFFETGFLPPKKMEGLPDFKTQEPQIQHAKKSENFRENLKNKMNYSAWHN